MVGTFFSYLWLYITTSAAGEALMSISLGSGLLARKDANHVSRVQMEPAAMHQTQCSGKPFDHLLHRLALGHHADIPQQAPQRHGAAHAPLRDDFKSAPLEESGQRAARIKDDVAVAAEAALASAEQPIHQRVVDRRLDDQQSARPQHPGYGADGAGRIVEMLDDVKHDHRIKRGR